MLLPTYRSSPNIISSHTKSLTRSSSCLKSGKMSRDKNAAFTSAATNNRTSNSTTECTLTHSTQLSIGNNNGACALLLFNSNNCSATSTPQFCKRTLLTLSVNCCLLACIFLNLTLSQHRANAVPACIFFNLPYSPRRPSPDRDVVTGTPPSIQ